MPQAKKKRRWLPLAALALLALLAALLLWRSPALRAQRLDRRAAALAADMSTDEQIGQVLLMNFRSWGRDTADRPRPMTVCADTVAQLIGDYHLGNILLFGENLSGTESAVGLCDALQRAAADAGGLPLLIAADQEGGMVTRLGQGTCLPGNMALGASGNTENAREAGALIGRELAALGINCDLAPVCDVNDDPENPVINLRSFSPDAGVAADMACAYLAGLHESGVIAAAKHFPGHGDTRTDTHLGLATVDKTRSQWEAVEATPFRAVIDSGVDMVMTAHIQYPGLDDTRAVSQSTGEELCLPATLSHRILTELLRGELGFQGVIVTDAMDMQAIAAHFGANEACIMALAAGADLICNPVTVAGEEDVEKLESLYAAIHAALRRGELTAQRLEDAARRVLRLKLEYGILDQKTPPVERQLRRALAVVGCEKHREIERRLADDGVAYVAAQPYQPFTLTAGETVLFCVQYENKGSSARFAMGRLAAEGVIPAVETQVCLFDGKTAIDGELDALLQAADHIVIVSQLSAESLRAPEHTDAALPLLLAQRVRQLGRSGDCAVISIGLPNDALRFPGLPVYVAYGYQGMDAGDAASGVITHKYGPNLPAAIDCLMGAFSPTGALLLAAPDP